MATITHNGQVYSAFLGDVKPAGRPLMKNGQPTGKVAKYPSTTATAVVPSATGAPGGQFVIANIPALEGAYRALAAAFIEGADALAAGQQPTVTTSVPATPATNGRPTFASK